MSALRIRLAQPELTAEDRATALRVLESGELAGGPAVRDFEARLAGAVGAGDAVSTSSGSAALYLALRAHGVGEGDEVITTPFTFFATLSAILLAGAVPVFVDVDETMTLDPDGVFAALTPKTRAVLPVHLFGMPADMERLGAIARDHNLVVIEDAAQALGARARYASEAIEPVGARHTCCFSLYATKNIGVGEGGAVTTNDPELASRMRALRTHGMREKHRSLELGFNFRMPAVTAALATSQIERLDAIVRSRRENARRYDALLGGIEDLALPPWPEGREPAPNLFTVQVAGGADRRDRVMHAVREAGVETGVYYPELASDQKTLRDRGLGAGELPRARALTGTCLSLPVHPGLTEADIEAVASALLRALAAG